MRITINTIPELKKLAETIADSLDHSEIFALIGDLGAGKTTFSKLLLKAVGVKKTVTSPTFVLMIPYFIKDTAYYHLDLYRLNTYKEVEALGITENWGQKNSVYLIEWADKIEKHLPKKTIQLEFALTKTGRVVTLTHPTKKMKDAIVTNIKSAK